MEEEYTLKEKLGEGAFAKVYLAVHKESGKKVALKVISLDEKEIGQNRREKALIGIYNSIINSIPDM